ncbi:MAG: licheninase, partial [Dactylosporangium sp.]|nr:licheninase [Dactylosporangium sp.]
MPSMSRLSPLVNRHRRPLVVTVTLTAVLAVLLAGYTAVTVGQARAASALLSQGKSTTASSVENTGTPASSAVDGNTGTRWSSAFADPQWLQVDLGSTATICQVVLNWESAY